MRAITVLLAVVDPSSPAVPPSSGTAELITVTCAGIAAILVAIGGLAGVRRRRADPGVTDDPEDRSARLRERLTGHDARLAALEHVGCADRISRLESTVDQVRDDVEDLTELVALLRAQGVVAESQVQRPRRRTTTPRKQQS